MSATSQLELGLQARVPVTRAERFAEFHARNPQVYAELVRLAREAKVAGLKHLGVRMLWEVCRWNFALRTSGDSGFKLNDHMSAAYARLIMQNEPDLRDAFEIRERR